MSSDFYERLDARVRDLESSVRGLRAELDASRVQPVSAEPTAPAAAGAAAPRRRPEARE